MPEFKILSLLAVDVALLWAPAFAAGPTLSPDWTFRGSSLAGWHTFGDAEWRARNGELTGTAKGSAGGWLVLDRSYQDVGFFASFRCASGCKTGVLLRAEKTPDGMKGVYVSLDEGPGAFYQVVLDAHGQEVQREKLRAPDGGRGRGGARAGAAAPTPAVALPFGRPEAGMRPGEWNEIEVLLDANALRLMLNSGPASTGTVDAEAGRFGPVALYIGGSGEVRFKDVGSKDLALRTTPIEKVSSRFRVQRVNDMFFSWSAGAADFNRDGYVDIVAGPFIYYGPDFTRSRPIFAQNALAPGREAPIANSEFTYDFNHDGWPDILIGPPRAILYINPKGEPRLWDQYVVVPAIESEVAVMQDIDHDGTPELVFTGGGYMRYAKPDPSDPTKPWIIHDVSEKGYSLAHGAGAGDINGDGRIDLLNPYGWWEQPADITQEPWPYHPEAFGWYSFNTAPGGPGMFVYDVNGDGLNDVVTPLTSHGFGLAWFEQKRDAAGKISFVRHMISDTYASKNAGGVTFSQPHGTALADIDGDGIPDLIVGKRHWSHGDTFGDPDPRSAPVLYWYRTVRNPKAPGGAEFVPELIHNRSGAGSDILATDLNKDGAIDIVTSTNRGTFIFWGKPLPGAAKPAAKPAGASKRQ